MPLPSLDDREGWKAFLQKDDWKLVRSEEACKAFRAVNSTHWKRIEYALFRLLSRRIEQVARRFTDGGLNNNGDDVVEEVTSLLLKTLRLPANFDNVSLCRGFRFIVMFRTLNCIKQEVNQRRLIETQSVDDFAEPEDPAASTPAKLEQLLDLRSALDNIRDPGRRRIVEMRLQGWEIQEIADDLGIPPDAAAYRLNAGVGEIIHHLAREAR